MRIIDAVVLIEKTSQMYAQDLVRVEQAGLIGAFKTFGEVFEIHELANVMSGDTFKFFPNDEVVDTFTDQSGSLLSDPEAEKNFINFAIGMNADMSQELSMEMRMAAVVDLASLNLDMVQKMIRIERFGVVMKDLFKDDYIYNCIRELCGFDMTQKYVEFLSDPFMSPEDLYDDLMAIGESKQ